MVSQNTDSHICFRLFVFGCVFFITSQNCSDPCKKHYKIFDFRQWMASSSLASHTASQTSKVGCVTSRSATHGRTQSLRTRWQSWIRSLPIVPTSRQTGKHLSNLLTSCTVCLNVHFSLIQLFQICLKTLTIMWLMV